MSNSTLYLAEQIKRIEAIAMHQSGVNSYALMQRAAAASLKVLRANWPEARNITVVTGAGNNAGDGWELQAALDSTDTALFFESPHRITKTLTLLAKLDGERPVCVARELTKKFQTWHRGTAADLANEFAARGDARVRGEITLVIAGLSREQVRQRHRQARRESRG